MDENVVSLRTTYYGDLPPEKVLHGALECNLTRVVVIGETEDGEVTWFSSDADAAVVNWLLDICKAQLMDTTRDDE